MTRRQVWVLLQAGCNVAEVAAAAGVGEDVARCMCDEAMGRDRGASLRSLDASALVQRQALAMAGGVVSL